MSIYNGISFGAHSEDYNGVSQQVAHGDTIHMPSTVKRAVFLYYVLNILWTKKHVELFISNIIVLFKCWEYNNTNFRTHTFSLKSYTSLTG